MSVGFKSIFLHALTPVHSGTGQTPAVIDLPVAREKATGWPFIPASSLKGVLRSQADKADEAAIFGSVDAAGSVSFSDQKLLLLPVRSFYGTYALVTCPYAVERLQRDRSALSVGMATANLSVPDTADEIALVTRTSKITKAGKVCLEDLDIDSNSDETATAVASFLASLIFTTLEEQESFCSRFVVVSNTVFSFLCETATEVSARNSLNPDTKTTTALWYEEAVPAEAIFCGAIVSTDQHSATHTAAFDLALKHLSSVGSLIQVGGKASIGRGLCRLVIAE